jgi:hypothetical protein
MADLKYLGTADLAKRWGYTVRVYVRGKRGYLANAG